MNYFFFFFSSRRRHTRLTCDWSSDVCSSDLHGASIAGGKDQRKAGRGGDFRLAGRGDLVERAGCKPPAERRIEGGNAERKGAFVGSYLGKFERQRPAQVCEHAMRGGRGGQGKFSIRRSEHGRRSPCGVFWKTRRRGYVHGLFLLIPGRGSVCKPYFAERGVALLG